MDKGTTLSPKQNKNQGRAINASQEAGAKERIQGCYGGIILIMMVPKALVIVLFNFVVILQPAD